MHCHTTQPYTHTHTHTLLRTCTHTSTHCYRTVVGFCWRQYIIASGSEDTQRKRSTLNCRNCPLPLPSLTSYSSLPLLLSSPDMPALWLPTNTCTFCVEPLARLCALLGAYVKWKFSIFYKVKKRKQKCRCLAARTAIWQYSSPSSSSSSPISFGLTGVWPSKNYVYVTWAGWLRFLCV